MPQGPGFLSRTFGHSAKKPSHSPNADNEGHPGQHAGVLRAQRIVWDEATADPRPSLATSPAVAPLPPEQLSARENDVPSQSINKTKKKGFKQLFVKWKQQLAHQLHPAAPVHQTSTSAAAPAATPVLSSSHQDSHCQKQEQPQRAAVLAAAVASNRVQPATSSAPRTYSSDTHHYCSSTSQGSTPPSSHAAATPTAAAYSPAAAAFSAHRTPGSAAAAAAAAPSPAFLRHVQAAPVVEHGRYGPVHRPSGPATPAQQQRQQSLRRGSSLLEQQIEQLIAVEPSCGARPASAAALPWSMGQPAPAQLTPTAAAATYAKPAAPATVAAAHPLPAFTTKPASCQHTAQAGPPTTAALSNTTALPVTEPQDSPVACEAAALAMQFAAARAHPPSGSSELTSSKEPALTYTSSAGMRSSSTASRSHMPGAHSHHVGSLAGSSAEDQEGEELEEMLSEQSAQKAAATAAPAVTEADVALWLSRCAVLQEKLSGGLMAADGKLQALTARSQLVQGILVSLPQGHQRSGKHTHLVPKLHSERARIAAEVSALKQRLQLLAVAINRLAAARQYLGSQIGAAMAAGDRVAILQLVLADVAERLCIWDWEELEGVAPLGDAGQQIREMLAAAAAAAATASGSRGNSEADSCAYRTQPAAAAAAAVPAAQAMQALPLATVPSRAGSGSAPVSTAGEGAAAAAAAAAVARQRAPPAKSASWHHQLPAHHQQLYQHWPPYHPLRAGWTVAGTTRTAASVAPAAGAADADADADAGGGGGGANLSHHTLQQHNMQRAISSRHPPGLPAAPVHAAQAAAAAAAASIAGSSRSRQHATSVPVSGAYIPPPTAAVSTAVTPRPQTSPATAPQSVPATQTQQQQQQQQQHAPAGYHIAAAPHAGTAAPHTTPAAAGAHAGRSENYGTGTLTPAAAAAVHEEVLLTSEAAAASYAANSGGKVTPDDELLLQYLGLSDSSSQAAADHAGVTGTTFVRSRQLPQHGASGGDSMTLTGAAQQQWTQRQLSQEQQQQEALCKRDAGAKGSSQREENEHGLDRDSEDEEAERDAAALVSDDVWGTVNSIFSTAASNMQTAGFSPSSSNFSQFTQATAGTGPGASTGGGTTQSVDAARSGRHAMQASSRNRAAMLAESLSAAQLLVQQQEDASSTDILSMCFEALQQLVVGGSTAAGHAQQTAAAAAADDGGAGSSSSGRQQQQQQRNYVARGPKSSTASTAVQPATPTAAAADDDITTADVWESADEGRDSGGAASDEQTSGTTGISLTLSPAAQGTSQGRPRSPPATASRHVHTFDSSSKGDVWQRRRPPVLQQQDAFDFGQQQQQQWKQQHGESGSSSSSSAPWSRWAPTSAAASAAAVPQGGEQPLASLTDPGRGTTNTNRAQHGPTAISAALPTVPEGAAFRRQSSLSSSAGSGSEAQFQVAGFSLTVRDLLQMLSHALQSTGTTEDLGSLPVAELIRQTSDVQQHSTGSHSQHSQQQLQQQHHFHPAEERRQ